MAENSTKHWQILGGFAEGTSQITEILLKNRSLNFPKQIEEFLNPPHPSTLGLEFLGVNQKEIEKAIKRIRKAINNQEQIIVYGDYDADGICGTAILWETLYRLGANVLPYIPHRVEEGYGLSQKGINNFLKTKPYFGASQNTSPKAKYTLVPKPSLIITVDHGITAWKEVSYAKGKRIDIIITDHHQKPKKLPASLATIWTDQISGAAVAWLLAKALIPNSQLLITNYLDLVALATIADLLPLRGPNRSLVKFGLGALNRTQRLGLLALFEEAGLSLGQIGTWEVSFILAPRLNAAGRIEHALDSLRLLCTKDPQKAKILAQKLGATNRERQRLTEEALLHAHSQVSTSQKLIFISHSSYNEGVIGLVAGRLAEEFFRPAIVVAEGQTYSKASARSINGINIIETIRKFEGLLADCGGHPMAAGFTIATTRLEDLKNRLLETVEREITPSQLEKTLKIDCEVDFSDLTWVLYEEISKFEPFGAGNPEPVFLTQKAKIKDLRLVGSDGKHLKLLLKPTMPIPDTRYPLPYLSAIGFGLGDWGQKLKIGDEADLVYTLLVDTWNGEERLQLKIKDLRPSR